MGSIQLIDKQAVILYFTSPGCNICKVLKPKVRELVEGKFPKMSIHVVDVSIHQGIAADFQVFTVPVILAYFEGKEYYRKVRNLSLFELEKEISRPYQLLFEL